MCSAILDNENILSLLVILSRNQFRTLVYYQYRIKFMSFTLIIESKTQL